MVAPRIVVQEPTFNVAVWNNVAISNIRGHVDSAGVRRMGSAYSGLSESYPDGIACITVLRASLTVGTTDTNAEAKRVMGEMREKILHAAIVIENEGMLGTLLRAVIRTLNSVARSSVLSIAPDLEGAASAIAPHVRVSSASSAEQIRAELLLAIVATRQEDPAPSP